WLLRVPDEVTPGPLPLKHLLTGTHFLINVQPDIPGVVFLPGTAGTGDGDSDEIGTAFVSHQEPSGLDVLHSVTVTKKSHSLFTYKQYPGIPIDVVCQGGRNEVLCMTDQSLVLCNRL